MPGWFEDVHRTATAAAPADHAWTVRAHWQRDETLALRRAELEPPTAADDRGIMVSVAVDRGVGFAATAEVSERGIADAFAAARAWAERSARAHLPVASELTQPATGDYRSPVREPWSAVGLGEKVDRLRELGTTLAGDDIADWGASLWHTEVDTVVWGSAGGVSRQAFSYLVPMISVTAVHGQDSQTRTLGGHARVGQGGMELLERVGFWDSGAGLREQARELVRAADCPNETTTLVLAPDQMILQIHESIGHPLELDRILGDERNYAGTSFVTPEMFGEYQYGSELLNIDFDPRVDGEFASYAFDDDGLRAEPVRIIERGLLLRPLGGRASQQRAGMEGVANRRAPSWNRPTIDRMANLNLAAGDCSFEQLIGSVESGVYMETNRSWSIDDSRNKFQFGCELGRVIRDGELAEVVKNPNYRGVSSNFWRSLDAVGNASTVEVLGTPFCGKGEPNQIIRVGHAAPACRFTEIDVFGGG